MNAPMSKLSQIKRATQVWSSPLVPLETSTLDGSLWLAIPMKINLGLDSQLFVVLL